MHCICVTSLSTLSEKPKLYPLGDCSVCALHLCKLHNHTHTIDCGASMPLLPRHLCCLPPVLPTFSRTLLLFLSVSTAFFLISPTASQFPHTNSLRPSFYPPHSHHFSVHTLPELSARCTHSPALRTLSELSTRCSPLYVWAPYTLSAPHPPCLSGPAP